MKITTIPSFGYNAQYHEKLHEDLSKVRKDKELAKYIIETDKLSLKLEDEVISMEKDKKKYNTPRFELLTDYLRDTKQNIAFYMNYAFPKFDYPENLIKHYSEEVISQTGKPQKEWRTKMINSLSGFVKVIPVSEEEKQKKAELQTTVTQTLNKASTQKAEKEVPATQLLELYQPNTKSPSGFKDVVGIEDVKLKLQENIVDYTSNPELAQQDFEEYGISAPRGFLFFGPPGCGKTYITKALAAESGLEMYKLDISKAGSKYINQTSINIQKVFDYLKEKAKKNGKPVLLFMDEVDALAMSRGSVMQNDENMKTVTTLLKLVEEAKDSGIIIIAATNKYDLLDEAFKARFDGQVYFPLPNEKEIQSLLKHLLEKRKKGEKLAGSEDELAKLAKELKGHSNRSITFIVDEASKLAKRRNRADISVEDIKKATETTELEKSKEKDYQKNSKARIIGF